VTARIHIDLFTTLDGVSQAPGGPDEDTDGGFRFGGWQAPLIDEADGAQIIAGIQAMDAVLRERHEDIHVIGSIDFARTLVARGLFDQLNLWVYPIVLGAGKRLFPPEGPPASLELIAAGTPSPAGTILLRYGPKGSTPETGDMT